MSATPPTGSLRASVPRPRGRRQRHGGSTTSPEPGTRGDETINGFHEALGPSRVPMFKNVKNPPTRTPRRHYFCDVKLTIVRAVLGDADEAGLGALTAHQPTRPPPSRQRIQSTCNVDVRTILMLALSCPTRDWKAALGAKSGAFQICTNTQPPTTKHASPFAHDVTALFYFLLHLNHIGVCG